MSRNISDDLGSLSSLLVGDIMVPLDKYPHIPYWFTLRQAIAEIENAEINIDGTISQARMVMVFDEKYRLLGLARRRDILRGLEPTFLSDAKPKSSSKYFDIAIDTNLSEFIWDKEIEALRKQAEKQISEVMQPILGFVDANDHIMKVVQEMVSHDYHMLPVLSEGKIAGVVRTVDVMRIVAKLVL